MSETMNERLTVLAKTGDVAGVREALAAGADTSDVHALRFAAEYGHPDIVRLLLLIDQWLEIGVDRLAAR